MYLPLEFFLHHEGQFRRRVTPCLMLTSPQRNSTRRQKHKPTNHTTTLKISNTLLNTPKSSSEKQKRKPCSKESQSRKHAGSTSLLLLATKPILPLKRTRNSSYNSPVVETLFSKSLHLRSLK